ncbi:MAG: hypothetical protein ABSF25_18625, partial [Bryobacteraceae bacterium]
IRPAPEGRKIALHVNPFACSGRLFRPPGAHTILVLTHGLRHGLLSFTPPGLVEKAVPMNGPASVLNTKYEFPKN